MATAVDIDAARGLAHALLRELPDRWRHTIGVARRAQQLSLTVAAGDRDLLISAAWLHDIGYSPALAETGLHPVDGARHLARRGLGPRLAGLIAHHSGAAFVAAEHGLSAAVDAFPYEFSPVTDALTYADQTVGPQGQRLSIEARMAEMLARHGDGSAQSRAHRARGPYLLAVADRVERRLAAHRAATRRQAVPS